MSAVFVKSKLGTFTYLSACKYNKKDSPVRIEVPKNCVKTKNIYKDLIYNLLF